MFQLQYFSCAINMFFCFPQCHVVCWHGGCNLDSEWRFTEALVDHLKPIFKTEQISPVFLNGGEDVAIRFWQGEGMWGIYVLRWTQNQTVSYVCSRSCWPEMNWHGCIFSVQTSSTLPSRWLSAAGNVVFLSLCLSIKKCNTCFFVEPQVLGLSEHG